ncbi:MAG: hypothetical protein AAF322_06535 [Pseudomonadota bacterium]
MDGDKIEKPNLADMRPEDKSPFSDVFSMRAAKFRYFDETMAMDANTAFTRFEDVNMSPERWVADLAKAFDLAPSSPFVSVDRYRGVAARPYRPRIFPKLTRRDFDLIKERVDHGIEAASGYQIRRRPHFDGLSLLDRRTRGGLNRYLKKGAHRGGARKR